MAVTQSLAGGGEGLAVECLGLVEARLEEAVKTKALEIVSGA